ncbi:MAG: hypothetical protein U5K81_14060 [Trueperaceae bacterium]|nr:hypothetical protein [Trueperaceae bacterium]
MPFRRHRPPRRCRDPRLLLAVLVAFTASVLLLVACAPSVSPNDTGAGTDPAAARREPQAIRSSPGCSLSRPAWPPEQVVVDGRERPVLARVPTGGDGPPRDLVIVFHGRTNDAARVRRYVDLDRALPEAVIVYPRALPARAGTFAWRNPGDPPGRLRDFALVEAIVETFGGATCIDLERVFVVGHSLGASFANDVACRLGQRIRAVASVAGGLQGRDCVGGAAAMILHHPDDRLVPFSVGERVRDAFRAANGLHATPAVPTRHPALAALRCVRFGEHDAENPVTWCPHDDATGPGGRHYPHTWPDGTAAAIRAFFATLP